MDFDKIPFVVFNTFGIVALILSRIISTRYANKKLNDIFQKLKSLKMEKHDLKIQQLDAATNYLASEIDIAIKEINREEGLSDNSKRNFVAKLSDLAGRIKGIGNSSGEILPAIMASSTPTPLGQGLYEANTDDSSTLNQQNDTAMQTVINSENTGENTPESDGAKSEPEKANVVYNPFPEPVAVLPGDNQTVLGERANANEGDKQTDPNKDDNPNNDEPLPGAIAENTITVKDKLVDKTKGNKSKK